MLVTIRTRRDCVATGEIHGRPVIVRLQSSIVVIATLHYDSDQRDGCYEFIHNGVTLFTDLSNADIVTNEGVVSAI